MLWVVRRMKIERLCFFSRMYSNGNGDNYGWRLVYRSWLLRRAVLVKRETCTIYAPQSISGVDAEDSCNMFYTIHDVSLRLHIIRLI